MSLGQNRHHSPTLFIVIKTWYILLVFNLYIVMANRHKIRPVAVHPLTYQPRSPSPILPIFLAPLVSASKKERRTGQGYSDRDGLRDTEGQTCTLGHGSVFLLHPYHMAERGLNSASLSSRV